MDLQFQKHFVKNIARQIRWRFTKMIKDETYDRDLPLIQQELNMLMLQNNMLYSYSKMAEINMEKENEKTN